MSAASKGQFYKAKTKKWLEANGYQVAFLERMMFIHTPKGRVPVKRDQFGSDLLAMSATEVVFVQVKGGASGKSNRSSGVREFERHVFPPFAQKWVVIWTPRVREPEIVKC